MENTWVKKIILSVLICLVFLGGYIAGKMSEAELVIYPNIRENSDKYTYINPLIIAGDLKDDSSFLEYHPLKETVGEYIGKAIRENKAENISFYFRDMNTSRWTGVDQDTPYSPSSMLKVIVMLAYFDEAETNPNILNKGLMYTVSTTSDQYFRDEVLSNGVHTVNELLSSMIIYSDNNALDTLFKNSEEHITEVNKTLRLPLPSNPDEDFMSARAYSRVFRALYNGTYLSKDISEKALNLLTRTTFKEGIRSTIPESIPVAHKFGERSWPKENDIKELHDCGIVYLPKNPYFLCVMTKGKDFQNLSSIIKGISKLVYENVSKM